MKTVSHIQLLAIYLASPLSLLFAVGSPSELREETLVAVTEPRASLDLVFDASGVIESVPISEGEEVAEGDPLVLLYSKSQELDREVARIRFEASVEKETLLSKKLERYAQLEKQDLASKDQMMDLRLEMAEARRTVEVSRNEMEKARVNLERRILSAPRQGIVFRLNRHPGEGVRPIEVVVEFLDTSRILARFFLPGDLPNSILPAIGDAINLIGPGEVTVEGEVDALDPFPDPISGRRRMVVLLAGSSEVGIGEEIHFELAELYSGDAE